MRAGWLIGLVVVMAASGAAAQSRDYLIDVWDTDRGLPSSLVTSVAQTHEGYLWAATQNGLVRFDGLRFVLFDPDNTPQLQHARVEHLFVDARGTLWINTYDGSIASWRDGVFHLEWKGAGPHRFEAFLAVSNARETVFVLDTGAVIRRAPASTTAWQVLRPPNTGLVPIFAEDAAGALWIKSVDNRLWRLKDGVLREAPTTGLASTRVRCLASDAEHRIWIGTSAELAVFDGDRFRTMTPLNGESRIDVVRLLLTRDGGQWVIANGRLRKARGRQWVWTDPIGKGLSGVAPQWWSGVEDRLGGVWFWLEGQGLLHVRSDAAARWIRVADGLPSDRIRHVLEDREGNIWLAIDHGGLARLRDSRFKVFAADGLRTPAAASVAEDRDGAIWMGSLGGGLQRFRDGVLAHVPLPGRSAGGFVYSVFPAPNGRLWISAEGEDLFVYDGGAVRHAGQNVHGIKAILVDRAGWVWIGTKDGLARLDAHTRRTFGPGDGFQSRDVRALAEAADGAIWIGSGDGTLYRYRDDRFESFRPDRSGAGGAAPIWSLLPDADGSIWIGTFRGGLLRLHDGAFTRYTADEGLPSNVICQILDDDVGRLWVGSSNGVFHVAKSALAQARGGTAVPLVRFGRSDGLPTLECSANYQPSGWRSRDGLLWFATSKGVVSVDPHESEGGRPLPVAIVEEMRVDQGLVGAASPLQIASGSHRLEFQFTGLSLASPEQVRFRYRLDGLEPAWIEAGAKRSANYSYLPPGTYRFIVSSSLGDGLWSPPATSPPFTVLPALPETWWFRAAFGLLAVAAVAGTVRYSSTRRLRRRLERLEWQRAVERDRNRIAQDIHDDLGAGLTQITLLSELARRDSRHEMEAQLAQISDTARELTQAVDEIVWAVNPRQDTLDSLVSYICQFAQEYLNVAGILCRLDVPASLPPQPLTADLRHNLFLAVKEALNNIVKHAQAREVWLRLAHEGARLMLVIEDDGCGFTEDAGAAEAPARASLGHGLENLASRLAAIGGRCAISSQPGCGTRVELTVSMP
jgi:signal transduction histidine kinase/ligand-binding sensor domain-containing protein